MTRQCRPVEVRGAEATRLAAVFPSFRDFVDLALFGDPCGYYSAGKVRFGLGGDYDTFPVALSPLFGRMVAQYGFRRWRRAGEPQVFELCELGAGNGQLCLDVLTSVANAADRRPAWGRFAQRLRYRIFERSPALIRRQQARLGPRAQQVCWTAADLSVHAEGRWPLAACGVVVANEVLDCLAHHKIVSRRDRSPGVVFVVPVLSPRNRGQIVLRQAQHGLRPAGQLQICNSVMPAVFKRASRRGGGAAEKHGFPLEDCGNDGHGILRATRMASGRLPNESAVPFAWLPRVLSDETTRARLRYEEVVLPLTAVPGLDDFVRRHYPEFFTGARFRPYFACPAIETLVANVARLYDECDILWIDYGDTRAFHLGTPCGQRLLAGPPPAGASIFRAPGAEDITFLVDFSVVAEAAYRAGLRVAFFGPQAELVRRSGVTLGDEAVEEIVDQRLKLARMNVGVRQDSAVESTRRSAARVRADTRRALAQFMGQRRNHFKLMIMRP